MKNEPKELTTQSRSEIENLISLAIKEKSPVEALERLLAMRKESKAESAKEAYDRALAGFQGECPIIERTKQGYNYKYAPIEVIAEQIKPFMVKYGLSYTFNTEEVDNKIIVYCTVTHVGGHTGEPSKAVIAKETTTKMNSSQQSGSVMTYGKRYSLMNALAIMVRDEDTDAASRPVETSRTYEKPQNSVNTYQEDTTPVQTTTDAYTEGFYAEKSNGWLKVEVSKLMNQGKIAKDMQKLNKMEREEMIALLQSMR